MKQSEFEKFDKTMKQLLTVTHSEIKEKLEAEQTVKRKKRKAKPSASSPVSRERD